MDDSETGFVDRLSGAASNAAALLRNNTGPTRNTAKDGEAENVSFEQALNSVATPVEAAVIEREWLARYYSPGLTEIEVAKSLESVHVAATDMERQFGPGWLYFVNRINDLVGESFVGFVQTVERDTSFEELMSSAEESSDVAVALAEQYQLDEQWENSEILLEVIFGYHSGVWYSSRPAVSDIDTDTQLLGRAEFALKKAIADEFVSSLKTDGTAN